jgi:hypothetical protein
MRNALALTSAGGVFRKLQITWFFANTALAKTT